MKGLIRWVARFLLPLARMVWRGLPAPVRNRLRGPVRRVRTAFGLGQWAKRADPAARLVNKYHPLVPLPIVAPVSELQRCPVTPADPDVTVVITAHDDDAFINTALQSIRRQDSTAW